MLLYIMMYALILKSEIIKSKLEPKLHNSHQQYLAAKNQVKSNFEKPKRQILMEIEKENKQVMLVLCIKNEGQELIVIILVQFAQLLELQVRIEMLKQSVLNILNAMNNPNEKMSLQTRSQAFLIELLTKTFELRKAI